MGRSILTLLGIALLGAAGYFVYLMVTPDGESPGPKKVETPVVEEDKPDEKPPAKVEPIKKPEVDETGNAPTPMGRRGEPTQLVGTVFDRNKKPLAGATVQLLRYEFNRSSQKRLVERFKENVFQTTTTGADGKYRFEELTPNEKFHLRANAPEYLTQIKDNVTVGMIANFNLREGARVEGVITDKDTGKPIANALVKGWYRTGRNIADVNQLFRWQQLIRTDDKGRFAFEGAPIGSVKFLLFHDEYDDATNDREVVRGETNRFEFEMNRGLVIEGVVLDKLTAKPIAGVDIQVSEFFVPRHYAKTDAEGRFRLVGVTRGNQRFTFKKKGYSETAVARAMSEEDMFDGTEGNAIEFTMAPAGQAAGTILGPDGQPISNAQVYVARKTPLMYQVRNHSEARTGGDGTFLVQDLNADQPYRLAAFKDGYAIGTSEDVIVGPGELKDGLTVKLGRGAAIRGQVTDEVGTPIVGARLEIEKPPYADVWFPPGMPLGQPGATEILSEDNGMYEFTGIWSGGYTFTITHDEHVPLNKQRVQVKGDDDQVTRDWTLKIGRYIAGSVTEDDGSPAVGVTVNATFTWSDKVEGSVKTDDDGLYRIKGLVKGTYRVQARKPGYSSKELFDIASDSDGVNFYLRQNGSLAGLVQSPNAQPVEAFTVTLIPLGPAGEVPSKGDKEGEARAFTGRRTFSFNDPGGFFKIDDLDPGPYAVAVTSTQFAMASVPRVEIPSGGIGDTGPILMPLGAILAGRVVEPSGAGVHDATVNIWNLDANKRGRTAEGKDKGAGEREASIGLPEQQARNVRVGRDGSYRFTGLTPGNYRVRVTTPRHLAPDDVTLALSEGQEKTQDYEVPLAAKVTVNLRDIFDEPVVSAIGNLRNAADNRRVNLRTGPIRSDARGAMTINGLGPGTYSLQITRQGFLVKEITLEVTPGATIVQSVQLEKI